ncbi:MAG: pentapeptide repeat-containing protein [Thermomicrobiales bacterium]
MDRGRFGALIRQVSARQSRRATLATLLGGIVLGQVRDAAGARKPRAPRAEATSVCYPRTRCVPGKGKNTSGCDYAGSTLFRNLDVRGANLSLGSFAGADMTGVDLRGANVSGSCFVEASLRNARFDASVNTRKAIFCGTVMPDGSINNRDCGRSTTCCPIFPDSPGSESEGGGGHDVTCLPSGTGCKPKHLAPTQPPCCPEATCSRIQPDGQLGLSACRRPDGSLD